MFDLGITGIGYNYLNLTNAVHIGFGQITNDISTKYRADVVKVRNESLKMSVGIAGRFLLRKQRITWMASNI
ncbi:hypothetical protein SAMN05443633_104435 [Chryseobacterium arachidis]|uniref:Uncharacterized protein n=1 Tax=Chryseobacterium arachidis TaxID=1416778 RepID=A0A1M5C7L6_9FLAO|nr:hypothetical protein [Chryseobacterium arachidis]SHF50739.1 hypothetical protein SAMN05443633_104435 [Chryseobacterium arachidis]